MTITLETRTVFHCTCIRCGHQWDAPRKPKRCSSCKYVSWNGEDQRYKDPYDFKEKHFSRKKGKVPVSSRFEIGEEAPSLPQPKALLDVFIKARGIIHQLIVDNPCNHGKNLCVCDEKKVLARLDRHINKMEQLFAGEEA